MSDFQIQVDAVVNIDKIVEQLKKKVENVKITVKTDNRELTAAITDNIKKAGKSSGIAFKKEFENELLNIKLLGNQREFDTVFGRIKDLKSKINSSMAGSTEDELIAYKRLYFQADALEKKFRKTKIESAEVAYNYSLGLEKKKISELSNILKAKRLDLQIGFKEGSIESIQSNLEKVQAEMADTASKIYKKTGGNALSEANDEETRVLKEHYNSLLSIQKRYQNKAININKKTAEAISSDISTKFKSGAISAEEALSRIKVELSKYADAYKTAQQKMSTKFTVGGVIDTKQTVAFSNLTAKEKEAVIVTKQLNAEMLKYSSAVKGAGQSSNSFLKTLMQFVSVRFIVYQLFQEFKNGLETLKEIDDVLIGIRKVTNMTAAEGQDLARSASDVVSNFGRVVTDYLSAYESFSKAGFAEAQVKSMSELSLLLQNVGDVSAEVANQTLLAANAGFQMKGEYDALAHSIDAMNNISNNNATTIEKMSEAIKTSASVAQTAGFTFDEYISLVGAATAATQREGSEVGRALRTIVASIRQVKDAEAEVDEETFAKAGQSLKAIADIDLRNSSGQIRDTMDVLSELAGKWSTLDSIQKQALANDIANKRQMDIFLSLMNNWTVVEKQLGEAINSTGSAIQENAVYLDSISAKTAEFTNAVTKMWQNTFNTSAIKDFISLGTDIISVIDKIGLGTIVTTVAVGAMVGKFNFLHKAVSGIFSPITKIIGGFGDLVQVFKLSSETGNSLNDVLKGLGTGADGARAALSALQSITAMALVSGMVFLIQKIDELNLSAKELNDTMTESYGVFEESSNKITSSFTTYEELITKSNKTAEEVIILKDAVKTLNEYFANSSVGNLGIVLDEITDKSKETYEALNMLSERDVELFKAENLYTYQEALKKSQQGISEYIREGGKGFWASAEFANIQVSLIGLNSALAEAGVNLKEFYSLKMGDQVDFLENLLLTKKELNLSDSALRNITQAYNEYSDVVKNLDDTISKYQSVQSMADKNNNKYQKTEESLVQTLDRKIDKTKKYIESSREQVKVNKVVEETAKDIEVALKAEEDQLKALQETMSKSSENAIALTQAMYDMKSGVGLSEDSIVSLITQYPTLIQYLDLATGKLNINADMLKSLADTEVDSARVTAQVYANKILSAKEYAGILTETAKKQIEALKIVSEAEVSGAQNGIITNLVAQGRPIMDAIAEARQQTSAMREQIGQYNKAISDLTALKLKISNISSGRSAKVEKTKTSAGEHSAEWNDAKEKIDRTLEQIRDNIIYSFSSGSISAKEALARVTKEVESIKRSYDAIKQKAESSWTAMEAALVEHYENMLDMQDEYQSQVESDYADAVSSVEGLQDKLVSAIEAKYEVERQAALDAIEERRTAEEAAFNARIDELQAEKEALQDTRAEDEISLDTLKRKLELSRKDTSAYGLKRTAELEAQIKDLEKKLAIADIDKEISDIERDKEAKTEYFDSQVDATNKMYDDMLANGAAYAEANRLIMSDNMTEIVRLIESYLPDFAGVGQMLGKTMGEEITSEVKKALENIPNVISGTAPVGTSYSPQTPGATGGSTPAPSSGTPAGGTGAGTSLAWDGTLYKAGSTGATVKRIQSNLINQGFSVGSYGADGIFGAMTTSAIKSFQAKNGLTVDGVVGQKTWEKLIKFKTGGNPVFSTIASGSSNKSGVAVIEDKERILTPGQNRDFEHLIYDIMPDLMGMKNDSNSIINNFHAPQVEINQTITNNKEFDLKNNNDNLSRVIRAELIRLGVRP